MSARKPEPPLAPRIATAQEVQDALVFLDGSGRGQLSTLPQSVSILEICRQILGFDPSNGQQSAAYGGKSPEGWYGQHISISKLRGTLAEMVEAGVVTEIIGRDDRAIRTPYRTNPKGKSYLLASRYGAAKDAQAAAERDKRRRALRLAEEQEFLAAHAAEIQAGYEARCALEGLSPAPEAAKGGSS